MTKRKLTKIEQAVLADPDAPIKHLAERLGCHAGSVWNAKKRLGIPTAGHGVMPFVGAELLENLEKSGLSIPKFAKKIGVSEPTIRRHIKDARQEAEGENRLDVLRRELIRRPVNEWGAACLSV